MIQVPFSSSSNIRRRSRVILAIAVALIASACSGSTPVEIDDAASAPLLDNGDRVRLAIEHGLEQTLELTPSRLRSGERLHIRSVIRNTGSVPKSAEALVCQLELRTTMQLRMMEPMILCFAYSARVTIAPGDSLELSASGVVHSRPGQYVLAVRHLLRPDIVAKVRVNVRAASD